MSRIALNDLSASHAEVAQEIAEGFQRVMDTTSFVGGTEVEEFEREFESFLGVRACVGVGNGTDAIELGLRGVGVGAGHEVILPANTFVATAEAVIRAGAKPVLVDCDPNTHLIDISAALSAITSRTKAVIPVHLYGQLAPVELLSKELTDSGIRIVEDAAQCHGATRWGHSAGWRGIAATSFHPAKNLGAYGDAGAVVGDDVVAVDMVRLLANHGRCTKFRHEIPGFNSRLDALQAVVLRARLKRLSRWNEARRAAAVRYTELLAGNVQAIELPTTLEGNEHVWHLFVVKIGERGERSKRRDELVDELKGRGVQVGIHYPLALHQYPAFARFACQRGSLRHAEDNAARIMSLPMHPHISTEQQERVVDALRLLI